MSPEGMKHGMHGPRQTQAVKLHGSPPSKELELGSRTYDQSQFSTVQDATKPGVKIKSILR